jgi:hypothetical protein
MMMIDDDVFDCLSEEMWQRKTTTKLKGNRQISTNEKWQRKKKDGFLIFWTLGME